MNVTTNTLVVGAGPAGLQLAQSLAESGVDHLLLEAGTAPGTFFRTFPRHRKLISINKVNVGLDPGNSLRYDWNSLLGDNASPRFTEYTTEYFPAADDMVRYLTDYAKHHALAIRTGERCIRIDRPAGQFEVQTDAGNRYQAQRVVLATGLSRPRIPPIPGIEHAVPYAELATNPRPYHNARVLIMGKGNSGFETADSLLEHAATIHVCSPSPVRFAWASHFVGHVRAVNSNFVDTYLLKLQNAVLDAQVTAIRPASEGYEVDLAYTHAGGHRVTYRYDRIIACTGFRFDDSLLAPALRTPLHHDGRLPAMTSSYESPTVPGLYYAGTITQSRDFKKTMSGFIHGFRYNVAFLAALLAGNGHVTPQTRVESEPEAIATAALERLNISDAIFLQPGFLADVLSYDETSADGAGLAFRPGIPLDFIRDGGLGPGPHYTINLEYGPLATDPFRIERRNSPDYANETPFLHPVLRCIHRGSEIARRDFLEDLENRFSAAEYLAPLREFFATVLTPE